METPYSDSNPEQSGDPTMRRVMDEYAQATGNPALYKEARKRVKARLGFYSHLATYLFVNTLLIGIWLVTSFSIGHFYYPWFIWPLFGWGIGVVANFFSVFVAGHGLEDRLIAQEMYKMNNSSSYR